MQWLNMVLLKIKDDRKENERYDDARLSFYTVIFLYYCIERRKDYDIENPITRKTAIVEFMNNLKYRKSSFYIKTL